MRDKRIDFIDRVRAGGWTGLVLQRVDDGVCITAAAVRTSYEGVFGALDTETKRPLVNVQINWPPARVVLALRDWAMRMGSEHLVHLLEEAVRRCPEGVRDTSRMFVDNTRAMFVDDRLYRIDRLEDGMRIQRRDTELTLRGPIVTRTNRERWLYLRGLTGPHAMAIADRLS